MQKLDFDKILDHRKAVLDKRKKELDDLKAVLKLSKPIEFTISDIVIDENVEKKKKKAEIPLFNFLGDIKGAVIYFYEIVDIEIKQDIIKNLAAYRSKNNKDRDGKDLRRSTAKLPNSAIENDTNILYVGSVKKNIYSRAKQHLGFGSPQTFSLQLKHWANQNWKFRFYYIRINNEDITTDIEAALSAELNPLIGKREK